jgi:tetratricopeptide (TPR) repeat protein
MARIIWFPLIILAIAGLTACDLDRRSAEEQAYASFADRHYLDTRIHLANALEEDPDNMALRRLLGETALALGDGQVAETAFRKVIQQDSTHADDVSLYLAHAHLLQGESDEALALIGEQEAAGSYALRLLAQARLQGGELSKAWTTIERAIVAAPNDADILALAGQYQLSTGNIDEAKQYARRAIASPKPGVEAYLLMGRIHSIQGELDNALEQYDAGIAHFRDHVRLYIGQAAVFADQQNAEKMETAVTNIERISPGHQGAIYITARYALNRGDIEKANEFAQLLEGASRNNPPLLLLLGEIQTKKGNIQQGISHLRAFLRLTPNHPTASLLLAKALDENGDKQEAFEVMSGAVYRASSPQKMVAYAAQLAKQTGDPTLSLLSRRSTTPPLVKIKDQLARVQKATRSGEWQTAANIYDNLTKGDFSNHPMLLNNAAMTHLRLGNGTRALELAERAYELAPDDPSVMDSVGWISLNVAKDHSKSLQLLKRAFQLDPGNMQIRLHLAQSLAINGQKTEARHHLERVMAVVDKEHHKAFEAILARL